MQNAKSIDHMENGILNGEGIILNIIWQYVLLEYYYCIGNIGRLKKKTKEQKI